VRAAPLKERKALLEKIVWRHGLEKTEPFIGEGRPLFSAVCKLDLEGIVAKRMADSYGPRTTRPIRKKWIGRSYSSAKLDAPDPHRRRE
jgi:ATP-dependent DNA ligase